MQELLEAYGLPKDHPAPVTIMRNSPKNSNIDIEEIDDVICRELIRNLNKIKVANMKVFCRGLKHLIAPEKQETIPVIHPSGTKTPTPTINVEHSNEDKNLKIIPGLSQEEAIKANSDRSLKFFLTNLD